MIRSSSQLYLSGPTSMAKKYVSRTRFWMACTFFCLVIIVLLYSRGCFWPQRFIITETVKQDKLAKDTINTKLTETQPLNRPIGAGNEAHGTNRDSQSDAQIFYGIMFDAGSTGSRIHVYQFSRKSKDSPLRLMNETFVAVKPGLSHYRQHPDEAARSLVPLLEIAMSKVPALKRPKTPVALKATAGLRLLPGNLAEVILDKVEDVIDDYPFRYNNNSVQIMDGADEGIFSWMTVNFLLGSLSGQSKLVAALDLGGGSTQITFVPNQQRTFRDAPKDYQTTVGLFGRNYQLYTHSYLGLGLMSARFQMMGGNEDPKASPTIDRKVLTSPCLPPGYEGTFDHHGIKFPIKRGTEKEMPLGYDVCYQSVRRLVTDTQHNVRSVVELNDLPVYIFSYYYDRAEETGLIDHTNGGNIALSDFKTKAQKVCSNHLQKYPYMCMDLVYIYSLLHDGFGINNNKRLHLKKKIEGVEISWALGAMFDMFSPGEGSSNS